MNIFKESSGNNVVEPMIWHLDSEQAKLVNELLMTTPQQNSELENLLNLTENITDNTQYYDFKKLIR